MSTQEENKAVNATSSKNSRMLNGVDQKYKPLCIGNSAKDLLLITICFLLLWVFIAIYYILLLHAALLTDDNSTVLWIFCGLFIVGVLFVAFVIFINDYEQDLKARCAAKEQNEARVASQLV